MSENLFINALWAALVIGALLPIVGQQLILRRAVLLGLVIPQIAMLGIAFVFLACARHWPGTGALDGEFSRALFGSLLFGVPALFCIATPWNRRSRMSEAWLAVIYLMAVSITNLILSNDAVGETYLNDLFHGSLLFIDASELRILAIVLAVNFLILFALRRRFLLTTMYPDYAFVAGLNFAGWTVLGTMLNGLAIGVVVASAGPLLAFGFLILPVLTAAIFTKSLRWNLWSSMGIGLLTAFAGFRLSLRFDAPLGDTVVAAGCVLLVLVYGIAKLKFRCRRSGPGG